MDWLWLVGWSNDELWQHTLCRITYSTWIFANNFLRAARLANYTDENHMPCMLSVNIFLWY